jgi:tRNA (guanine37-N1)-methyltransferase
MKISVLTLFPDIYKPFFATSLIGKAVEKKIIDYSINDMFTACRPKERIDAATYGHGAGMVIKPEAVESMINTVESVHGRAYRIFFSPHGIKLDQRVCREIVEKSAAHNNHIMTIAARYEGMDARVEEEFADIILSVGDFVLMGGDLPSMLCIEAILRYVPGVIGNEASVEHDSFTGALVDYPEYSAPLVWRNREVPAILRSGNHATIAQWRLQAAAKRTMQNHFEWFRSAYPSEAEVAAIKKEIPSHYAVLMHDEIMLPQERIGTTSVTSLDLHDIARSARTYGLKKYFIVTPLVDQQRIVKTLLDFWNIGAGVTYNKERHEAVSLVELYSTFDEVKKRIVELENKEPLVIATSAKAGSDIDIITYKDQGMIWKFERPVLFVFGTGRGLANAFMSLCDYALVPLKGMSSYNHLSVRSAAAVIFDRWLGLQPRSKK